MNRKEFTNLLLEWRKNFVNERTFNNYDIPSLGSQLSTKQIEDLKKINFPIHLLSVPLPIHANIGKAIAEKNEKNYYRFRDYIIDAFKTAEPEHVNLHLDDKTIYYHYDDQSELERLRDTASDEEMAAATSSEAIEKLYQFFEDNKDKLNDELPLFIYQTSLSTGPVDIDGGTFRISDLPDKIAGTNLAWTFIHDFWHQLEVLVDWDEMREVLDKYNLREIVRFIKAPRLEITAIDEGDNDPSVLPHILYEDDEGIEKFVRDNIMSIQEFEDNLQYLSQEDKEATINYFKESDENYDNFVNNKIQVLQEFIPVYRELFDLAKYKNKIVLFGDQL